MKTKLKLDEVYPGIFHVLSPNYKHIKETWMRFEEAYENPVFHIKKGFKKKFTKRDILKWWDTTEEGKKHVYWFESFNIPSYILKPFYKGKFDPLNNWEKALLKLLLPVFKKKKKFYIIGTVENPRTDEYKHEVAHGLFYVSRDYRTEANKIISKLTRETLKKLDKYLHKGNGYDKSVLADERHAWIMVEKPKYFLRAGIKYSEISKVRRALNRLYKKFINNKV